MLTIFHHRFCARSKLYRRWHEHPHHPGHHWLAAVLALCMGSYAIAGAWRVALDEQEFLAGATAAAADAGSAVGIADLTMLAENWGRTDKPASDINQDGAVDVFDLALLMANWGKVTGGCGVAGNACIVAQNPSVECSDGKDNDGDGFIDFGSDPGCSSAGDLREDDILPLALSEQDSITINAFSVTPTNSFNSPYAIWCNPLIPAILYA